MIFRGACPFNFFHQKYKDCDRTTVCKIILRLETLITQLLAKYKFFKTCLKFHMFKKLQFLSITGIFRQTVSTLWISWQQYESNTLFFNFVSCEPLIREDNKYRRQSNSLNCFLYLKKNQVVIAWFGCKTHLFKFV